MQEQENSELEDEILDEASSDKIILELPDFVSMVALELELKNYQVSFVLESIKAWDTVPFITRYRKEKTGDLDEEQIRKIIELNKKAETLHKAKQTAINGINDAWKLTDELFRNILKAKTLKEVEEIYKPYKSKKKTKAMLAIEKWFQIVADAIKQNSSFEIPADLLEKYTFEEIIEWSKDIIIAEIVANSDLRADLLDTLQKYSNIISKLKWEKALEKLNEKDKAQISKFEIYSDFSLKISYLKPYQILALNRWENIWILWVKIEKTDMTFTWIKFHYARLLKTKTPFIIELEESFKAWYDVLFSSVENELRWILSELAEDDAIETFKQNLKALLMTKPVYNKTILAIDPWFAAGCKMAILDDIWNPVSFDKIYLHKKDETISKLKLILQKNKIDVIVIWNGTWSNEVLEVLNTLTDLEIYIVNESWASVYSASKLWREEFPELDSLDRWTISIARRFIDPLSELVKVPVGSIWVGMYQHDMPEKKLEEKLGFTVEDTVNDIWININTASSYVLEYISGIDKKTAKKIYKNRPYKSRIELKKQLSVKAYEQAIWFLRIPESKEKLDNTDIHPEQYELAKYILENAITDKNFAENKLVLEKIYPDINISTIKFILSSIDNAWIEKRINSTHKKAGKKWKTRIESVRYNRMNNQKCSGFLSFCRYLNKKWLTCSYKSNNR